MPGGRRQRSLVALVVAVGLEEVRRDSTLIRDALSKTGHVDTGRVTRAAVTRRGWRRGRTTLTLVVARGVRVVAVGIRLHAVAALAHPLVALGVADPVAVVLEVDPGRARGADILLVASVLDCGRGEPWRSVSEPSQGERAAARLRADG